MAEPLIRFARSKNGSVLKMKDFFAQTGVEKLIYH